MAYRQGAVILQNPLASLLALLCRLLWNGVRFAFVASGGTAASFAFFLITVSAAGSGAWYFTLWVNPVAPMWLVGLNGLALWWLLVVGSDVFRLLVLGRPTGQGGSARFAKFHEYACKRWRPGALYLGQTLRSDTGFSWSLGHHDDRHVLCLAASRGGKGTSLIVPNLLKWPAGVLAIDPKGELASICATHRPSDTVVLDPYNDTADHPLRGTFNPLAELDPEASDIAERVGVIVDALVISEPGAEHWTEGSSTLLSGLIAHCLMTEDEPSLAHVRDSLTQADEQLDVTLEAMRLHQGPVTLARMAKAAANLLSCDVRQRSGFLTTANRSTAFLESTPMREQVASSTFRMSDLKARDLSLFICLPERYITQNARWMRLLVNLAMASMTESKVKTEHPVLMVLDEFKNLGFLKQLENVQAIGAGSGLKVMTVLQNFGQLKSAGYRDPQTFLSNAGLIWAGAIGDPETARLLSDAIGKRMRPKWERRDRGGLETGVPLLDPSELSRLLERGKGKALVLAQGCPPMKVKRVPYYKQGRPIRDFDLPVELREQGA